ncbi:hypothetical protein [Streptomyces lannensis]|uniref:hypothetical protein n=1 Tax=Streptomyces lannensis TaxID=766498 RepID=UPI0031E96CF0
MIKQFGRLTHTAPSTASHPQKETATVFQETPIFSRLVAERGDVPNQVRGEADRIHRDLSRVMPWTSATDLPVRTTLDGPTW